jgi:membrane fusion protein, multidrug efflux system
MTRRMTIMLVVVGLLFASVVGFQLFMKTMINKFISAMLQPLQSVTPVTQHG